MPLSATLTALGQILPPSMKTVLTVHFLIRGH